MFSRHDGKAAWLGVVTAWACAITSAAQSSIVLRARAQVQEHSPVLLRDVADLQGSEALALGEVVVLEGVRVGRTGASISPQQVREVLRARRDANLGRITIAGSPTRIEVAAARQVSEVAPTLAPPPVHATTTLREALPASLARALGIEPEDLRVDLSRVEESILSTSLDGRTLAVAPTSSSDPLPLSVRVYEGDRVVLATTIRVPAQVRARRCAASRDLPRGHIMTAGDIEEDESWLSPGASALTASQAVGQSVRTALRAGQRIEQRHLAPALAVRKGDLVSVDCLRGGVLIRTTMRAKQDGAAGDVIALEPMNALERRGVRTNDAQPVRGRVAGPGAVVMGDPEHASGAPIATSATRPEDPDGATLRDGVVP